jgi:ParB-like chromosome segregation protein Spo0J
MTTLTAKLIRLDSIDVPDSYERKASLVEDDALRKSVQQSREVQQSVIVIDTGDGRYTLAKGLRRLGVAEEEGHHNIHAVIMPLPAGENLDAYRDRLRFVLTQARQDLRPSQRASLIKQLMATYGMDQKDVAAYLGVDGGTITNWLAIERYHPDIVKMIDADEMTLHAARSFDGMKLEAQPRVYRSLRKEFQTLAGGKLHKLVRAKFSPKAHPDFYVAPQKTLEKMGRTRKGRSSRHRKPLSRSEKELLANDLGLKEVELADGKEELLRLKREITLATPPIRAILRNKELMALIPPETLFELQAFGEAYC